PNCGCWVLAHRPKPIAVVTNRGMTHSRCGLRVRLRRLRSRMMIRATPMPISGPMVCGDIRNSPPNAVSLSRRTALEKRRSGRGDRLFDGAEDGVAPVVQHLDADGVAVLEEGGLGLAGQDGLDG